MEIITKKLPPNHNIAFFTCVHFGTIHQHLYGVEEMVETIASDPMTWCAGGGDWIESLMVDDKRFDIANVDERANVPVKQYSFARVKFRPVADKMLVALEGNHDYYVTRKAGNLLYENFCKVLNIRYGSYSSKLIIKDNKGKTMYKVFFTHGRKGIGSTADDPVRRDANMKLQLKRHLQNKAGDTLVMVKGHAHKLIVCRPSRELYLIDDGKRVLQQYTYNTPADEYIDPSLRWYACCGSFLKLYREPVAIINEDGEKEYIPVSGYAERAEYDPVELGYVMLKVRDRQVVDMQKVIL